MNERLAALWIAITADKKKAWIFVALLAIGAITVTRALLTSRPGPGGAGPTAKGVALTRPAKSSKAGSDETSAKDQKAVRRQTVRLAAVDGVSRNIFLPSERYFPLPSQTDAADEEAPKSPDGNDDKSHEEEIARARQAAQRIEKESSKLHLRSTMMGANPLVVVESTGGGRPAGLVLRPGQSIDGFTLIEVRSDRAILEKEGVRIELCLPRP